MKKILTVTIITAILALFVSACGTESGKKDIVPKTLGVTSSPAPVGDWTSAKRLETVNQKKKAFMSYADGGGGGESDSPLASIPPLDINCVALESCEKFSFKVPYSDSSEIVPTGATVAEGSTIVCSSLEFEGATPTAIIGSVPTTVSEDSNTLQLQRENGNTMTSFIFTEVAKNDCTNLSTALYTAMAKDLSDLKDKEYTIDVQATIKQIADGSAIGIAWVPTQYFNITPTDKDGQTVKVQMGIEGRLIGKPKGLTSPDGAPAKLQSLPPVLSIDDYCYYGSLCRTCQSVSLSLWSANLNCQIPLEKKQISLLVDSCSAQVSDLPKDPNSPAILDKLDTVGEKAFYYVDNESALNERFFFRSDACVLKNKTSLLVEISNITAYKHDENGNVVIDSLAGACPGFAIVSERNEAENYVEFQILPFGGLDLFSGLTQYSQIDQSFKRIGVLFSDVAGQPLTYRISCDSKSN